MRTIRFRSSRRSPRGQRSATTTCSYACRRVPCAEPTWMSRRDGSPPRTIRSSPVTRPSARSRPSGRASATAREGDRVGIAWIRWACGECRWCTSGRENLCPRFQSNGCDGDGGYAEYVSAPATFTIPIPAALDDYARGAAAVRRRHRMAVAPVSEHRRRRAARPDRLRRFGASRAPHGSPPPSEFAHLRFRTKRRGACVCARARRGVGRRLDRSAARAARGHHRHDARLEAGRRGAPQAAARRAASSSTPSGRATPIGRSCCDCGTRPISGWNARSRASPT